jgi:hypothetical protein
VPQPESPEALIYGHSEAARVLPELHQSGLYLASNAFDMMSSPYMVDKVRQAPYPRLQRQLDALGQAEAVVRQGVYNFIDPRTGAEVQLSDII